jgi:hypothetical protein
MTLRAWLENRWLVRRAPTQEAVGRLLELAERREQDGAAAGLSADMRLTLAYEGVLQCALAALLAEGYAPSRDRHHELAVNALALTIGVSPQEVQYYHTLRAKRNTALYEMAGVTTEAEAAEAVKLARKLRHDTRRWIKQHHPDLLSA